MKREEEVEVEKVRTDLKELQNVIGNQLAEQANQLFKKILEKRNFTEEEIKNLKRENNELKVKYNEFKAKHDELKLEHDEFKLEYNEWKLEHNELKLKFVKAEREKEVNRKCRYFVGKFLFKLSKKLNYDMLTLSDEYEYRNRQEVKKKIESQLGFVKMKADEFKQISDFRLSSNNDYFHSVEIQSTYDAQIMLSNMDFPKDMEYLRTPLNKALKALQTWDNEN
ncbi:hypothetical protein RclHR1_10720008 [Rhizophagus clarus]|uniref:Uncharacterized protein n=1 Tax=Rhizophagus clarus TaxID=94130 RepID=A0A2Z6Q2N7_9GLOM|nr:hypothetical protein RclHR1_10720008 [Rhizophagus clarus]GES94942.1 hypothetical protein RCL_jg19160.t1 [Rhizophagus clarus]